MSSDRRYDGSHYVFDNASPLAPDMLNDLSGMLNSDTMRVLNRYHGLEPGMRCMDVGAGNGSLAVELAEEVRGGVVTALDKNIRHIPRDKGLTIVEADVPSEELPAGPFDLIHARLVLIHLSEPERGRLIKAMVARLAPRGTLALGSWGQTGHGCILVAADLALPEIYDRYQMTLVKVLMAHGSDPGFTTGAHLALVEAGLTCVTTVGVGGESWEGGTHGAMLAVHVSLELEDKLVASGLSKAELVRMRDGLQDPGTVVLSNTMLYTLGQRPGGVQR